MRKEREEYSFEGHAWQISKTAGKQVCSQCGLVFLRNPSTAWCVEKGCNYKLHSSYKRAISNLTKPDWL